MRKFDRIVSEGYRLNQHFANNEETNIERHYPPVLNISNEHTKFNHTPYSSLCLKLRKMGIFLHYTDAKFFGKKLYYRFLHPWISRNLYFSWRSSIWRLTEPVKDSAIHYLEHGKQKRKQTNNPRWLPILDL